MDRFKGIIALDIDGTITVEKHTLELPVKNYLNDLIREGWLLIFVTGRTFSFAKPILSTLEGSYLLAVQNGAALFEMPSEKLIKKNYVKISSIPKLEGRFPGLLIESGKEKGDLCYYKPSSFSPQELEYINFRIEISPEAWVPLHSFDELDLEDFAVGKVLGVKQDERFDSNEFNLIVIRDPFREDSYLAHVNARRASKGQALRCLIQGYENLPLIVAGDDYNDREMLEMGTIKVVMEDAPDPLKAIADIIAPPASQLGIILSLKEAICGRIDQN